MAEQAQGTSTEQSSSTQQQTQDSTQSLEQVYKQFNVEETAQSFQTQQQGRTEQQQVTEVAVPDPVLDAEGFKKYQATQSQNLQKALSSIKDELTATRVERLRTKEEADIKSAVERFRQVAGEDVDADMAEVVLGQKVRKDPKFLSVYTNRDKNPQAWSAAVAAVANEFKSKFQFKVDPQIAQNQQAARQSIGSQSKTNAEETQGDEALFKGKSGKDFDRVWRNYVDRY